MSEVSRARVKLSGSRFANLRSAVVRRPAPTDRVTIEKAKLRVVLDQELGRVTPQSVKDLAKRES